jgi:glycine/D-amino acid oxidase-like deaminating enzyme
VADSQALLEEFELIEASGQSVNFDVVDGDRARREEPALAEDIETAIRIHDERFIDPSTYVHAIAEAARPLLRGADLDNRQDEWVGSRPCTVDALPLIGATKSPRVFAAGGHGMWGITLGPVTGRLLAETMVTGKQVDQLRPFDPMR